MWNVVGPPNRIWGLILGMLLAGVIPVAGQERREPLVALKTNALYDLVGVANVGIELPLGEKFSVAASGNFGRWRVDALSLQVASGSLDVKYWPEFSRRHMKRRLLGFSVGAFVCVGGPWEIQSQQGWQGDNFFSTGIVAGYATPISEHVSVEFSLGAGWFFTPEARHYHNLGRNIFVWQQTRLGVSRPSPVRAGVSFVWAIGK